MQVATKYQEGQTLETISGFIVTVIKQTGYTLKVSYGLDSRGNDVVGFILVYNIK